MFTRGKDAKAAGLARDIYLHTVGIMAGAETLGVYRSLAERAVPRQYWPLELFKLTLAPPERELAPRGAGDGPASGLGRARPRLAAAARTWCHGPRRGRARAVGRGRRARGSLTAVACALDVTRYGDVDAARSSGRRWSSAGWTWWSPTPESRTARRSSAGAEDWERSLAVNATGHSW